MSEFTAYLDTGFHHIINWKGLDHILFVAALALRYQFADWRKVLVLVTAFTIGHSITLALTAFDLLNYSTRWIEFLIPVTIVITAASNAFVKKFAYRSKFPLVYFFALFFGLVHGMGFGNGLRSLLGRHQSIIVQLLGFNIGLEIGQILVVLAVLIISFIFTSVFKCSRREYILYFSGSIFGISLLIATEQLRALLNH